MSYQEYIWGIVILLKPAFITAVCFLLAGIVIWFYLLLALWLRKRGAQIRKLEEGFTIDECQFICRVIMEIHGPLNPEEVFLVTRFLGRSKPYVDTQVEKFVRSKTKKGK